MLVTNLVQEYQLLLDEGIFSDEDMRRSIETRPARSFLNRARASPSEIAVRAIKADLRQTPSPHHQRRTSEWQQALAHDD